MTSAINPNNIDGTYPVAGQDNNSQGFRDNFTNIKTNFQYAEDEITDLQNNVILKSALSGTTLNNDMLGSGLSNAVLNDMGYTLLPLGASPGPSFTVNYALGTYQTVTLNTSATFGFSNFPAAGVAGEVYLQVTVNDTAYTLTLPAVVSLGLTGIQGISGQVITFAATGTYNFRFTTNNGGSIVTVYDLNRPLNYYTNAVTVVANTVSTSTTTGALIVSGGAGIAGNLNVGGSGIIAGDLTVTGNLVATGNIAGDKIFNGTTSIEIQTSSGNANISVGGVSNVALFTTTGADITGTLSGTGNVSGGNLITAGQVVAVGNVSGGNLITAGQVVAAGNVSGGNLNAVGDVSGTNITGTVATAAQPNITSVGTLTSLAVTGNIAGGNVSTTGSVSLAGITVSSGAEDLAASGAASLTLNTSYFTTAGSETATLAAGVNGQIKTFAAVDVSLGNMVITVTNPAWTGSGTITFDAAGDACTLQYIDSKWFVIGNNGCTFA
jgi:hypothetical protein